MYGAKITVLSCLILKEMLPLLLSPSPAVTTHVIHALSTITSPDAEASASKAEEPPFALLLAQAAYLSSRRLAHRRAALWYLIAANRLEKSGIVRSRPRSVLGHY